MELTERLRKAIDAEEARLRVLPPFPWKVNPEDNEEVLAADNIMVASVFSLSSNQGRRTAEHIVAGSPERGLRRITADREILDAYEYADNVAGSGMSPEGNYANGLEFAVKRIAEYYQVEV